MELTTSGTADPPAGQGAAGAFWRYWAATAVSYTGAGISQVAIPLIALSVLNVSNLEMGILTAAGYAAVVVIGLPAGVLVRRFPLRTAQVAMDLFRAVAMLSIPVAVWIGHLTLAQLIAVALLVGMAGTLFDVANSTYLPSIVPHEQLAARNGLLSGTHATTQTVGPGIGGLLVQTVGAPISILVDAISYVVSATLLSATRPPAPPPSEVSANRIPLFRQINEGLRFVFSHPVIRPAAIAATAINFAGGAQIAVMTPYLVRSLGLAPGSVGLVLALDGIGTVLGAAVTARLSRRFGSANILLGATSAAAAFALLMPATTGALALLAFGTGLAGFGAGVAVFSILTRTHRQIASPPEMLSRVMASVRFVSWSAVPAGSLVAGIVAQVTSPRVGLAPACIAALVAPAVLWWSSIRRMRDLDQTGQ